MIGVIIVGHGEFAKGINSVIELVAGRQDLLELISFTEDNSSDDLRRNIDLAIKKLDTKETLIFTDIPGGTPFKESAILSTIHAGVEVIAGTNIPMLLEILFDRTEGSLTTTKNKALNIGKDQILSFEIEEDENNDMKIGI